MTNNIPYLRNKIPTLLTISVAALALLMLTSPLVLSHFLLQPVQATGKNIPGLTSIQTSNPVALGDFCNVANAELTFNAQSADNGATLSSGTFKVTNSSNSSQIWWSGGFDSASAGGAAQDEVDIFYNVDKNGLNGGELCGAGTLLSVEAYCTQPPPNPNIIVSTNGGIVGGVNGIVNCEFLSDTTAQPSSSSSVTGTTTTITQDSDDDGIPDSSDRCTHNSNPRCFKEGDASTTTTAQQ
jgi:hypothetical protein